MTTRRYRKPNRLSRTRSKRGGTNEAENKKLFEGAAMGPLESVKTALQKGADINAKDDEFKTPLTIALEENEDEIADYLITRGANIDETLNWAIQSEDVDIAEKSLKKGADPNAEDSNGDVCALWWACWVKDIELVKLLLKQPNIDVNARCNRGQTPLMIASMNTRRQGDMDIVKLLLKQPNIDVDARDKSGRTAFTRVEGDNKDIIENLITKHIEKQPAKQKLEREFIPKHLIKQGNRQGLEIVKTEAHFPMEVGQRTMPDDIAKKVEGFIGVGGKRKTRKNKRKSRKNKRRSRKNKRRSRKNKRSRINRKARS